MLFLLVVNSTHIDSCRLPIISSSIQIIWAWLPQALIKTFIIRGFSKQVKHKTGRIRGKLNYILAFLVVCNCCCIPTIESVRTTEVQRLHQASLTVWLTSSCSPSVSHSLDSSSTTPESPMPLERDEQPSLPSLYDILLGWDSSSCNCSSPQEWKSALPLSFWGKSFYNCIMF